MKKIDNIIFIQDDAMDCLLNKAMAEDLQLANKIQCLDDEQQAILYLREYCKLNSITGENTLALVFLDTSLPFFDAFDFLKNLEKCQDILAEKLFIVMLTESWEFTDIEKTKNLRVNGYLNKPLTEEKLKDVVLRALEGHPA